MVLPRAATRRVREARIVRDAMVAHERGESEEVTAVAAADIRRPQLHSRWIPSGGGKALSVKLIVVAHLAIGRVLSREAGGAVRVVTDGPGIPVVVGGAHVEILAELVV